MKESRRVDQGIRRRAMIKSKISCLSNLKNLVAKLLLSSAKFFSLSNYVSSKSLRTGQRSSEMPSQFQLMKALKYLWHSKTPFGVQFDAEADSDS
ncbi:BnaC04g11610D [Brassica napus]|uniref:BnaC04g11610D protein n=1 Tax=Brassica napus TaxID=3708 RepID=A0A078G414_BRANA|nr:BnaC04g11610D [Brassica napus]